MNSKRLLRWPRDPVSQLIRHRESSTLLGVTAIPGSEHSFFAQTPTSRASMLIYRWPLIGTASVSSSWTPAAGSPAPRTLPRGPSSTTDFRLRLAFSRLDPYRPPFTTLGVLYSLLAMPLGSIRSPTSPSAWARTPGTKQGKFSYHTDVVATCIDSFSG